MPDPLLLFLGLAGAGVLAFHALLALGALDPWAGRRRRQWREAARAVGLDQIEETRTTLSGRTGELRVSISRYEGARSRGSRVSVAGPGLPKALTVRPQSLGPTVRGALENVIGDPAFDRTAWVEGPPALARALLDSRTRPVFQGLFEGRLDTLGRQSFWASGRLERGVLTIDVPEVAPGTPEERVSWLSDEIQNPTGDAGEQAVAGRDRLPEALQRILSLARRLAPPEDLPRRLAENLKTEPEGGVRLQLLTTLFREFLDSPLAREALLAAREDPDPQVRLRAGITLGQEGTDVLVHLADGEGADDSITEKAVAALGERLSVGQAASILRGSLRTRRTATARACIALLGERGGAEGAAMLARVLAVETPALAAAAATALADTNEASAEGPLLAALDSPHTKVRIAAARALGRTGTVDAIVRLREAESDDSPVRAAARQAIATIQSRLPGAERGQLSLAGGESGRLSLASADGGHLSLAREKD